MKTHTRSSKRNVHRRRLTAFEMPVHLRITPLVEQPVPTPSHLGYQWTRWRREGLTMVDFPNYERQRIEA